MKSYRVTKYNPKNRDDQGRYLASEWTSIFDIGRKYCGHVLTEKEYEKVENSYLDIAREDFWCCLESGSGAFIHVGYDYYMCVGGPTEGLKCKALATTRNLFVEEICASPCKTEI